MWSRQRIGSIRERKRNVMEILMRISNHSSFEEDCSKCINSNEEWKIEKKIVTSLFVILFLLKVKLINLLYLLIAYYFIMFY